jgi:hypothetical protein
LVLARAPAPAPAAAATAATATASSCLSSRTYQFLFSVCLACGSCRSCSGGGRCSSPVTECSCTVWRSCEADLIYTVVRVTTTTFSQIRLSSTYVTTSSISSACLLLLLYCFLLHFGASLLAQNSPLFESVFVTTSCWFELLDRFSLYTIFALFRYNELRIRLPFSVIFVTYTYARSLSEFSMLKVTNSFYYHNGNQRQFQTSFVSHLISFLLPYHHACLPNVLQHRWSI